MHSPCIKVFSFMIGFIQQFQQRSAFVVPSRIVPRIHIEDGEDERKTVSLCSVDPRLFQSLIAHDITLKLIHPEWRLSVSLLDNLHRLFDGHVWRKRKWPTPTFPNAGSVSHVFSYFSNTSYSIRTNDCRLCGGSALVIVKINVKSGTVMKW